MADNRRLGPRLVTVRAPEAPPQLDDNKPKELVRDVHNPYAPHILPDLENRKVPGLGEQPQVRAIQDTLPGLRRDADALGACDAQWNSVALFYNLEIPDAKRPADYSTTTIQGARDFLDEGTGALTPGISEFLCRYWSALSYGKLAFGLNTPRDVAGNPLIPTIRVNNDDPQDWQDMINRCLDQVADAAWRAAGGLMKDRLRWIPSVVLVQNYWTHASAFFGAYTRTFGGQSYIVGDRTHIAYSLQTWSPPDAPRKVGRPWWGTLCHEYAHNFLEFWDLYGPSGCTGYWDLLGDNSPPGRMSEVCSAIKARVGWLSFKAVITGPTRPAESLSLQPYTTTGEAYKVIPDPEHTPHEYFLLEFRKSTGDEVWRPDGGLRESGLLITHVNDRLGVPRTWLLREAPFLDPEFADDPAPTYVDWSGHDDLEGKLFPQGRKNAFTPSTTPSSRLYGHRNSGLFITEIAVSGDRCTFDLYIDGQPQVGWRMGAYDRAMAGRFSPLAAAQGEEIFIRNDNQAALLVHRQAQWMVNRAERGWIGHWNLGRDDRERVGDLDGDGLDEIYIRSSEWAGVLKYERGRFRSVVVQHDWIDEWSLAADDWEHMADLDGDGMVEVYIRSKEGAGVAKLDGSQLRLLRMHQRKIDGWNLGPDDREFVGRFSTQQRDEVLVRSPQRLGLLQWSHRLARLELVRIQHDWVDGWSLGPRDEHFIGDFDGDGYDEIFIRSPEWAGLLKYEQGRFRVLWMTNRVIDHVNGHPNDAWALAAQDRHYSGRFRFDRDGVLIRNDNWGLAVLAWDGDAMRVHQTLPSPFSYRWNFGSQDNFVLGDFHRRAPDVADAPYDTVIDGLTDVFVYNAWGTGMVGVNHGPTYPSDLVDQMGLTWMQASKLMNED